MQILAGLAIAWLLVLSCLLICVCRKEGDQPRFESSWGGLGRGIGGWSVNWPFCFALLEFILTCGIVAVAVQVVTPAAAPKANTERAEQQKETPKADSKVTETQTAKAPEKK